MTALPNEIAGIALGEGDFPVPMRALHEKLESSTKFADWIKRRLTDHPFEDGIDFISDLGKSTGAE